MADSINENPNDIRILILEDNPSDAELIEYELREAGCVFSAKIVEEESGYIEALREFRPDIILSDYDLPSFSGWEALRIKKELCPEVPFILVTGAVGEERAIEVLTGGATDYILKRNLSRLLPAVKRALYEAYEHRKRKEAEAERDLLLRDLEKQVHERTKKLEAEIVERKQAREALKRERDLLQAIMDGAVNSHLVYLDRDFNFIRVNETYARSCGYKPEEMIGKNHFALYPNEENEAIFTRVRDTGRSEEYNDKPFIFPDQPQRGITYWNWTLNPIEDDSGSVKGLVFSLTETTERKRAEEKLKESEKRFRNYFEMPFMGMAITSPEKGWLEVNDKLCSMLGYSREELSKKTWAELTHPDDLAPDLEQFNKMLSGQIDSYLLDKRFIRKDGTNIWTNLAIGCIRNPDGSVKQVSASILDITERKRAEESFRENRKQYRDLVETANSIIMKVDQSGKVSFSNQYAQEFFGYSSEEILGMDMRRFVPQSQADSGRNLEELLRILLENPDQFPESVNENIRKNGERVWISWRNKAIRDSDGKIKGFLAIGQDVTERMRAEDKLKERSAQLEYANQELESFSYSVSHDLRAPLRAIDGFSKMILEKARDVGEDSRRMLQVIRANALKMDRLIDDILDFSRAGRAEISRKCIDMEKLMMALWREQAAAHPERKMELKENKLPEAVGDESLVRQVLSNLLANAVKFSKNRETVLIEVGGESTGTEHIYYVRDNGAGFDMKHYDKLFGVFQRLHSESEYEGTGVGLAIVQRIIHRHGGRVWAESKVGEGATFYFSLPAA